MKEYIDNHRVLVVLAVLAGFIIAVLGVMAVQPYGSTNKVDLDTALYVDAEKAGIDYIIASLRVYYIEYSNYPYSFDSIKEQEGGPMMTALSNLDNFKYEVRGDREAYKLTYTSKTGEQKEVTGEYRKDYQ